MADDALLLIPGLGETGDLFGKVLPALRSRRRCAIAATGRYHDMRMEASAILMQAPPVFSLMGHAMGGYLAFEIMRLAPARVTRLMLISTRAGADSQEQRQQGEDMIRKAEEEGIDAVHEAHWPDQISPGASDAEGLRARACAMIEATGVSRYVMQQRAILSRINYFGVMAEIRVPTSIVVGADDVVTPPALSRTMMSVIRNADLTVLQNCGHLLPLERPVDLVAAIDRWLARATR